jgi:hypothetical protein
VPIILTPSVHTVPDVGGGKQSINYHNFTTMTIFNLLINTRSRRTKAAEPLFLD